MLACSASQRLKEIRQGYESHTMTPQQRRQAESQAQTGLLDMMRRNGAAPEAIAAFTASLQAVDRLTAAAEDERDDERDRIVSWTFNYSGGINNAVGASRRITITSEGSRNWRVATTEDVGSIVFLREDNEFGELDDLETEEDEDFPGEFHTEAVIYTQSGNQHRPWASNNIFESIRVVPHEVLEGVRNEAPPGKFFSGRSDSTAQRWSPAPPGQVWFKNPLSKNPNGQYLSDRQFYHLNFFLEIGSFGNDPEKLWDLRGSKAYWCPVLRRFISEGERLRSEHWFHNGNGSAQQRYYYNQFEMLDRHGGLASLPEQYNQEEVTMTEVRSPQEVLNLKFLLAEKKGKVINLT